METEFSKVSLGFAEFVSQLLRETFDAILDAQNYQLDKLAELKTILQNDSKIFFERYCSSEEVNQLAESNLGYKPDINRVMSPFEIEFLNEILIETQNLIFNNKLTLEGENTIFEYYKQKVIQLKKDKLLNIINKPELAVLMVDSGEIRAKLDLFCYNESSKPNKESKSKLEIDKIIIPTTKQKLVKEIIDIDTGQKTLIIDKTKIDEQLSFELPMTRLIANPITTSTTTSLFSEVIIKFKTI